MKRTLLAFNVTVALTLCLGIAAGCSSGTKDTMPTSPTKGTEGQAPNGSSSPSGQQPSGSNSTDNDESISSPSIINGAYMTAIRIPAGASGNSIKIGVAGMVNNDRMSKFDDLYKSAWELVFKGPIPVAVQLSKSSNTEFDQVLDFFGTEEQYQQFSKQIEISLLFKENKNGSIVNSVIQNSLFELAP